MGFQVCGRKCSVHHQTHPPPWKKSPEIYFEDLLTAAAATQSRCFIIHLFLRGYKTLVNYCLKCCPKTQRRSRTVCLSREWRHETTGQACNHSFVSCQCFYAFSFIEFFLVVCGLQKYTCRMWFYCDYFSTNVIKSKSSILNGCNCEMIVKAPLSVYRGPRSGAYFTSYKNTFSQQISAFETWSMWWGYEAVSLMMVCVCVCVYAWDLIHPLSGGCQL